MSYYFRNSPIFIETKNIIEGQIGIGNDFVALLAEAYGLVGKLDGMCRFAPNIDLYSKLLIIQEVCASCELENIPARFYNFFDNESVLKCASLPLNLLNAIKYAQDCNFSENFIKRLHGILATSEVAESKYRNSLGVSRESVFFYYGSNPIPINWIAAAIGEMEKYFSGIGYQDALTAAARIQYQLEILDPFDHYSRVIARIMAMFALKHGGLLAFPVLWLSDYLLKAKIEYKDRLTSAYEQGEEALSIFWINFFLTAVKASAKKTIHLIESLSGARQTHISMLPQISNGNKSIQSIYEYIEKTIIVNVRQISDALDLSFSSVTRVVKIFEEVGILRQVTQKERYRQFGYVPVLDLIRYC